MILNNHHCNNIENKLKCTISYICQNEYHYFLNKRNVVGIGLGYKRKNNFYTYQLCIQVFVIKKIPPNHLSCNDLVPLLYKDIPTDVIETGIFTAFALKERIRPVLGGYGISADRHDYSGTVSCLVTNGVSNFILAANHTLANNNLLPIGTPILQPSYKYGGFNPNDTIGTLYKFIPIRFFTETSQPINFSDCALGLLNKPNILSPDIALIGRLNGVKKPILNEKVRKVGTTTELTEGIVTSTNSTMEVNFGGGQRALFQNLISTTRMLSPGDCGAILINKHNFGLGMALSGSDNSSSYCSLDLVLDQLDVKLVT